MAGAAILSMMGTISCDPISSALPTTAGEVLVKAWGGQVQEKPWRNGKAPLQKKVEIFQVLLLPEGR